MRTYTKEVDMYQDIIDSISKKLSFLGYKFKVFKTWQSFDPELKAMYPQVCAILNKEVLPDITVVYQNQNGENKCLIIEVKIGNLTVKDIGQAKIYTEVFNADSALLVSLVKVRKSFVEFHNHNEHFLKCSNGAQLYICALENEQLQLQSCFPSDGGILK